MSKPDIYIQPSNPEVHIESQGFYLARAIGNFDQYRTLVRTGLAKESDEAMFTALDDKLHDWVERRLGAVYEEIHTYPDDIIEKVRTRALTRLYEYGKMFHFPVDRNPEDWNLAGFLRKFQSDGLDPALTYLLCHREMEGVIGGFLTDLLREQ